MINKENIDLSAPFGGQGAGGEALKRSLSFASWLGHFLSRQSFVPLRRVVNKSSHNRSGLF